MERKGEKENNLFGNKRETGERKIMFKKGRNYGEKCMYMYTCMYM